MSSCHDLILENDIDFFLIQVSIKTLWCVWSNIRHTRTASLLYKAFVKMWPIWPSYFNDTFLLTGQFHFHRLYNVMWLTFCSGNFQVTLIHQLEELPSFVPYLHGCWSFDHCPLLLPHVHCMTRYNPLGTVLICKVCYDILTSLLYNRFS